MNNGRVFLSCCSSPTWILLRNSGLTITQSFFSQIFNQQSSATLTERRTCVAQIIHARGFVNLVQSNKHQHLNVLSRSSLHFVSDAGNEPNRATWRPQLRLQMFALPFHCECDLRLEIGCLTTRRVSVPAALRVLHCFQISRSVPCGKRGYAQAFFWLWAICSTDMDVFHRCAERRSDFTFLCP